MPYMLYIYSNTCIYTIYIKGWIGMPPAHEFCPVLMHNTYTKRTVKNLCDNQAERWDILELGHILKSTYSTFTPSSHTTHFYSFFPIPYFHAHFPS